MLKVGIIGLGTISVIHKLAIDASDYGELVAVCDIEENVRNKFQKFSFYTDYQEMIIKESLDVVHLCLPHHLHVPIAIECLKFGVHIFMEKPVGMNLLEVTRLKKIVNSSKSKLGVCFQNRYNKTSEVLLDLLNSPDNGNVLALKANVTWYRDQAYYRNQPWRGKMNQAGGGTIINQSIHTLDLLQLLSKQKIVDCKGVLTQLMDYDIEVEDTAIAQFNFTENVKVLFYATNAYVTNSSVELEVLTSKKRYVIKDYRLFEAENSNNEILKLICEDDVAETTKSYYGQGHNLAINQFYRSIIDDTNNYISVEEALISLQMIDMMKKSNELNKRVRVEELI